MGEAWTADYLKITGELDVDLRSNIAAEARAKIVYERLINFTDDQGTIEALQFLMTREITHMKAFTAALESMGKPDVLDRAHSADTRGWWINISTTPPGSATAGNRMRADRGTKAATGRWFLRPPFRSWNPPSPDPATQFGAP